MGFKVALTASGGGVGCGRLGASALAVLLIGIQEACGGVGAVSCPLLLELLIPGSPGQGTDILQGLQVIVF